MILVMCGVLFVFAFTLVAQTANCTRAAKLISELTRDLKEARLDNEALKRDISELESGERIAREAVFTLGMVEPPNTLRYVVVPDIPAKDEPQVVTAESESWVRIALKTLGGYE
jgi:cell division protein FtsB